MNPLEVFPRGLLRPELFLGKISGLSAHQARIELSAAGEPSASHFEAGRYGRGEVGEFVLIEGQVDLVLARLVEVRVPERERRGPADGRGSPKLEAFGFLQFLGTVRSDSLRVEAGVSSYPRLGDRVFAAPHRFVGMVPVLMTPESAESEVRLTIGHVGGKADAAVSVRPEKLFGRHCAVLGATGGGKSWTVATLVQQSMRHHAKIVVLDATSEYRTTQGAQVSHFHLGVPVHPAPNSALLRVGPSDFEESDFIAMFEPSGKVQGPKLREAMKSLRLVAVEPQLATNGVLVKANAEKARVERMFKKHLDVVESPRSSFDPAKLARQVGEECVYPDLKNSPGSWGGYSDQEKGYCFALQSRIALIVRSDAFAPVFREDAGESADFTSEVERFVDDPARRVLRVCLSGISFEFRAREFVVNAIGRRLLNLARAGRFATQPLLVVLDEAHNFLGRTVGYEDASVRLDAFELIAREGRKYGLNLCLATQRPRDLTEGVLSQIGTLIVHRLTNDRDREIVERACGEVDRSVTAFLANLRQGEAAVLGVDFPIPLTVQIARPQHPPDSSGPDYQRAWAGGPPKPECGPGGSADDAPNTRGAE